MIDFKRSTPGARLLGALLCAAALALPTQALAGSWIGDTTSGWAHFGGGVGLGDDFPETVPGGRVLGGAGFYTIGFYAGGELAATFTPSLPGAVTGVAMLGFHIPTPVVHPMFGFRVGGGAATDGDSPGPLAVAGGQAGVIIRQFDGRFGVRLMIDADAVVLRTRKPTLLFGDTVESSVHPQVMGTVAFVW